MRAILGRYALSISAAAAFFAGCGGSQSQIGAPVVPSYSGDSFPHHKTFHYSGNRQSFRVPNNVTKLQVVALGAAGAGGRRYFGRGGRVYAIIPVQPGEKLYVVVGGQGSTAGGFNGGGNPGFGQTGFGYPGFGGGGASDVREGGTALSDRIVVAAGGGGPGCCLRDAGVGGNGGGAIGEAGGNSYYGAGGGGGGTQRQGGAGGIGNGYDEDGFPGDLGDGGHGGNTRPYSSCNGSNYNCQGGGGGGGGGGYYGGGGGAGGVTYYSGGVPGAGGGGGSSYVERYAVKARFWRGWKTANGNGLVVFSWQ